MFSNHSTHSLDQQGRFQIPLRWREELGTSPVITRGLDQCLFVFSADRFERLARQLERLAFVKSDARSLSRYLFAEASTAGTDQDGRILLTPALRAFAGIEGQVTIVGVNDRLEIWNPRRYADTDARVQDEAAAAAERIGDLLQNVLAIS